jgi:hypothetical protein
MIYIKPACSPPRRCSSPPDDAFRQRRCGVPTGLQGSGVGPVLRRLTNGYPLSATTTPVAAALLTNIANLAADLVE